MKKKLKGILFFETIFLMLILTGVSSSNALIVETNKDSFIRNFSMYNDFTDITPKYAWDMLNDPSAENGIQIPIDVRSETEWRDKRIKTPFPEHPRHFSLTYLKTEEGMKEFISMYNNSEIIVYCQSGVRSSSAANKIDNSDFSGVIYNLVGGISNWIDSGYPVKLGNDPPNQPETPIGPSFGRTGKEITFSTISGDPDNDPLIYGWDWDGDETVDEWTEYYSSDTTVEITHVYTEGGTYNVKVLALDNVGDESLFSEPLNIVINNKPDSPLIEGPLSGKPGEEYTYTFTVTDPDEDDLYLYIEWGDDTSEDWAGPYESSDEIDFNKKWDKEGDYIIRAKTKDEYDAESEWSSIEVTLPKTKMIKGFYFSSFYNLFNRDILPCF